MIIYLAEFPNGKKYVGQTVEQLWKRKSNHIGLAKKGCSTAFHLAIKKYGIDSIQWSIIDTASTIEEMNKKEIFWIKKHNSLVASSGGNGYNLRHGGAMGRHSIESRKKMSNSKLGVKFLSDEHYDKLSEKFSGTGNPFFGKKHSIETRNKISVIQLGRKISSKHKANISLGHGVGPINVFKKDTLEYIGTFDSPSDCARKLGLNVGHICSCIRGDTRLKTHGGFVFKKLHG